MKPKKLIWKLFPTALLYLSITFICIYLLFSYFLMDTFREGVFKELKEKSFYLEEPISRVVIKDDLDKLALEIDKLKSRGNLWITILDAKGKVLVDSEEVFVGDMYLDNQPEILNALDGKDTSVYRESNLNRQKNYFYAHPFKANEKVYAILRLGLAERYLEDEISVIRTRSLLIAILVSLTGFFFYFWSAIKVSIPLGSMLKAARAISKGELDIKVPVSMLESEEVHGLGKYLSRMGKQLRDSSETLEEKEIEQQAVLSAMREGVISVSPDKKVLQINKAMRKILGLNEGEEFRGRPLLEVVRNPKFIEFLDEALKGINFVENDFQFDKDKIFQVHGGPLYNTQENNLLGAFLVLNDLTEIKTLEKYRKEFISNISHELRTPITAIQGYLETMIDGKVDDPKTNEKFMGIIQKQALRLSDIVEDLLKLSQIESGSVDFEMRPLKQLVNSSVDICKERATKKNIVIEVEVEDELSAKVNHNLMQQALVNLIDNAIKYSPEQSTITIYVEKVDGEISINVMDRGPGIAHEHHERLFERFYSVDKARSKELGGSGIGLAIVKHIARAHGGREGVISDPGEGSTFSIYLKNQ